jgi:ABC-type nitrate/sulfonate/bicarbonate transport system ATPase subunit
MTNKELDIEIEKMVDEYRSAVLLASHDLTNDKAISLVAYATISLRGKIKRLAELRSQLDEQKHYLPTAAKNKE